MKKLPAAVIFALLALSRTALPEPLSRESIMAQFPEGMAEKLCKHDTIQRKCYSLSDEECHRLTVKSAQDCVEKLADELSASASSREDTVTWGAKVGACAAGQLAIEAQKLGKRDGACLRRESAAAAAAKKP